MNPTDLLNALHVAERLKDATRHCYTSGGRHESVGEHSWRAALMAYWVKDAFPEADIEIIEKHHNRKLDVPSGTALILANSIREVRENAVFHIGRHTNGKRTVEEIGIHSIRIGNEVGTHEIIISNGNETITLKHEAENRALFAEGALKAAAFLCGKKPGLYGMKDMLG